jgi:hypothetical protein
MEYVTELLKYELAARLGCFAFTSLFRGIREFAPSEPCVLLSDSLAPHWHVDGTVLIDPKHWITITQGIAWNQNQFLQNMHEGQWFPHR